LDDGKDFAYAVSSEVLEKNTITVLKLVRSAMIYFCLAVKYCEENKKNTSSGDLMVPLDTPMIED